MAAALFFIRVRTRIRARPTVALQIGAGNGEKKCYGRRVTHLRVEAPPGTPSATSRFVKSRSPLIKRHSFEPHRRDL